MRLVVTRPEPDASRTARDLRNLGHEPILGPLMTPKFHEAPADWADPPPSALLLTSGNALRAIAAWPGANVLRDVPVLAVGDRTADAVGAAGFGSIASASGDVADLVDLVQSSLPPDRGVILYPAAIERTGDLEGRLARAGYRVRTIDAYEMISAFALPDRVASGLTAGAIDGVLFYSRRTAEIFVRLVDQAGLRPQASVLNLFALSARVAEPLDFGVVAIAARPNDAALLALLDGTGGSPLR